MKAHIDSLEGKLVLEREKTDRLSVDNAKLTEQLMKADSDQRTTSYQLAALQIDLKAQEADRERSEAESRKQIARQQEAAMQVTLNALKQQYASKLVAERSQHDEMAFKLRCAVEDGQKEVARLQELLANREKERQLLNQQLEETKFHRPRVDGTSQTAATEDGLWDQQNGWILPISSTTIARNRWRNVINFARCPACKGNSRFIAQAAVLFKQAALGHTPVGLVDDSSLAEDSTMKWVLPDNLVSFLANLPPTVQAWNPHSLVWTVKMSFILLDYKQHVDKQDKSHNYALQSFLDFLIETFLHKVSNRSQAELALYQYIRSLREHHQGQYLLHLMARALECSRALSSEERARVNDLRKRGEEALQRKRKKQLDDLKARQRLKALQDRQEVENEAQFEAQQPMNEKDFVLQEDALVKEVLSACLFARRCLFAGPYKGVYREAICTVKGAYPLFQGFEDSLRKAKQKFWSEGGGGEELHIPAHCVFNVHDKYQLCVPLDRAVRVVKPFLSSCSSAEALGVWRALEGKTTFLHGNGDIYLPDGTLPLLFWTC